MAKNKNYKNPNKIIVWHMVYKLIFPFKNKTVCWGLVSITIFYLFSVITSASAAAVTTTYTSDNSVILAIPATSKFLQATVNGTSTCALTVGQATYCSGDNTYGQLGNGTTVSSTTPVPFGASLGKKFSQVSAGSVTCSLTIDQLVYCSGNNTYGQLGNGTTTASATPVPFGTSLGKKFTQVSGGTYTYSTCALTIDQLIYCSGYNYKGQFGNGTTASSSTPVQFGASIGKTFAQLSTTIGSMNTCGLTTDQLVYCSGSNFYGQLGNGSNFDFYTPLQFGASLGKKFSQVSSTDAFTCALTIDQLIYCSGYNYYGQFGNGTTASSSTPVQFGASLGKKFSYVSTSNSNTCGLTTDQLVYCSGANMHGQLGSGTTANSYTPVPFGAVGDRKYAQVTVSDRNTCALTIDQIIYCSGNNTDGQLGTGNTSSHTNPIHAFLLP